MLRTEFMTADGYCNNPIGVIPHILTTTLQKDLIDQIGYFDKAVEAAHELANIKNAKVVEYERPFTFSTLFGSQAKSLWNIDRNTLHEYTVPQLLYLWDASW